MSKRKYPKAAEVPTRANQIFSKVRQKWVTLTPEERVRQDLLEVLLIEYGYSLDQIGEEIPVTERGAAQARADFVVWRTIQDRLDENSPSLWWSARRTT